MGIIRQDSDYRKVVRKPKTPLPPQVVKKLFAYYSPTGRKQPPGLLRRASAVASSVPREVIYRLYKSGGRIVFVHEDDVLERRPIPKQIQKMIGGMDLGILGDIANMYAPSASIDSKRPMVFLSTDPTRGLSYEGPKGIGTVERHELGHSASNDMYLRRMLGLLYRGVERKSPVVARKQAGFVQDRRNQGTMGPGFSISLGHRDKTFPADKFEWPDRWNPSLKDLPNEWVNEEKWAESFAYYTDPKWKKRLHPDVARYFYDVFGE